MDIDKLNFWKPLGLILLVGLMGYGIWWYWFAYTPKAYVGIVEIEWSPRTAESSASTIYEVDIEDGEVSDQFKVGVPYVQALTLDRRRGHLYVAGGKLIGDNLYPDVGAPIEVYDIFSKEKIRTIERPGEAPIVDMRISPDGERLFINRPYSDVYEKDNIPDGPKGKKTWVIDSQTGQFLDSFDKKVYRHHFLSSNGEQLYFVYGGPKNKKAGKSIYSIKKKKLLKGYANRDRLFKEGVYQPDLKRNFVLDFPHFYGTSPMKAYDRDTGKLIGEVQNIYREFNDIARKAGIDPNIRWTYNYLPEMISKDHRYRAIGAVVGNRKDSQKPSIAYLRSIDIKEFKIHNTVKIATFTGDHSNFVVY